MGLEAHSSLARLHKEWPTVKGLANRPDDAAEWAGRKPDGKALRTGSALQRAISQADADARTAALFATLEADAKGASSQVRSAALAGLARLRSCARSLASAWLTARLGPAKLMAVEFCISARVRLGEDLFAGQDGDDSCVCGRSMAAGVTHSLICGALWHTVVARHNALTEAWLRIAARGGIAATREPHVQQLPQRPHATGLPALPTPASAVPSTLHGTQAPHPPVPSASAVPPTPGDAAAAGQSAPVAPGEASAAAVPAAANAAATPSSAVATAPPAVAPPPTPNPPTPPGAATAAAHPGGATGTTRLPPRSQRDPQRSDLLLYLPWQLVVVDVCVTHPLASSAVAAAAWGTGVSAEAKDAFVITQSPPRPKGPLALYVHTQETVDHTLLRVAVCSTTVEADSVCM